MSSYYPHAGQQPQPPPHASYPQYGAPPGQQPAQNPGYPPQAQHPGYAAQGQQQDGIPTYHEVNDEQMAQAYAQSQEGRFGPQPQFLKVPGPRGQLTWDNTVPVNYMGYVYIRICSPWERNKPVFVQQKTHFYRSKKFPKGRILHFQGEDSLFMQAITLAAQSDDPRLQRVATDYGRVRTQYLYNVIDLSHPESHIGQDGVMRPYILSAGKQLNTEIGQLADHRGGISKFCHPTHGRALKLTKTKTGPETLNVEYGVMDVDPAPLDPYFYPILENLWDLEAQLQQPSQEEVMEAIRELGLPMPRHGGVQVPANYGGNAAYDPNPNPPHTNPYAAAQAPGGAPPPAHYGAPQGQAPSYGAPPPGYGAPQGQPPAGGPPPAYDAPPPGYGAPQGQPPAGGAPPAYDAPPPGYGAPQGQPPAGGAPPAYDAPPPGYGAPPSGYGAPPPGQGAGGAPPPAYGAPPPGYGGPQGPAPGGAPPPAYGQQSAAPLPHTGGQHPGVPAAPNPPPNSPPPVQSGGAGHSPYPMHGGQPPN